MHPAINAHQQRLRDARYTLEQHVPARQQRCQQFVDGQILTHNATADGGAQCGDGIGRMKRQIRRGHVQRKGRSRSKALRINVRCRGAQRRKVGRGGG